MNMEMLYLMHCKLKLMTDLPPHHTLKSKIQLVANVDCEFIISGRFQALFEIFYTIKAAVAAAAIYTISLSGGSSHQTLPCLTGLSSQPFSCACSEKPC